MSTNTGKWTLFAGVGAVALIVVMGLMSLSLFSGLTTVYRWANRAVGYNRPMFYQDSGNGSMMNGNSGNGSQRGGMMNKNSGNGSQRGSMMNGNSGNGLQRGGMMNGNSGNGSQRGGRGNFGNGEAYPTTKTTAPALVRSTINSNFCR